jgi:hypothetical protein
MNSRISKREVKTMKKVLYVLLAVMMVLPMIVSCSSAPEGEPVAFANVEVVAFDAAAYADGTRDDSLGVQIHTGEVTAYAADVNAVTLKEVIEGYTYDKQIDSVMNEYGTMYESLAGYAADGTFFWNYYVNGKECSLSTVVKPSDTIKIVFEK